jgi:hypothetical protein
VAAIARSAVEHRDEPANEAGARLREGPASVDRVPRDETRAVATEKRRRNAVRRLFDAEKPLTLRDSLKTIAGSCPRRGTQAVNGGRL